MTSKTVRFAILAALAIGASGCNTFRKKTPKTPVIGERIAVLTSENEVAVDLATAAIPMVLPAAVENSEWSQSGGNAAHSMGHVALGTSLGQAFVVSAGRGATATQRLASPPVVSGGRVFTIDTMGTVRAFDATAGSLAWAVQTPTERGNESSLYGGGVAVAGGRVFATNGLGFVVALDSATGGQLWQARPGGPLRGAPTVAGDSLYVMSQDNQIFALAQADGAVRWSQAAALEIAGVFGSGSPAYANGTVVAGFSSGELNAYRYENGRQVWQDALQRTSISTSVSTISDIDAEPVIDLGQVFAVGQGGRMVALDLNTGQRLWESNIAGIATPWVAGEWLFVITDDARLICFSRTTGKVRWINELPAFENMKKKKGQIDYWGPVLAGGRLIVAGANGALINIEPATGSFQSQTGIKASISVPPVVANSTLYILDDRGQLHAFR